MIKLTKKSSIRLLNEFLIYTQKNPQYSDALGKAISYFQDDKEVQVAKEIGKFYVNKKDWPNATKYFEMHLKSVSDDVETGLLLMQCYVEQADFNKLITKSDEWIQLFPTQPQFYYFQGLGYNQTQNFKKAKDILEMGMDYLVDDIATEINFNIQLGEAYHGLGNKEQYFTKANELLKKKR